MQHCDDIQLGLHVFKSNWDLIPHRDQEAIDYAEEK